MGLLTGGTVQTPEGPSPPAVSPSREQSEGEQPPSMSEVCKAARKQLQNDLYGRTPLIYNKTTSSDVLTESV